MNELAAEYGLKHGKQEKHDADEIDLRELLEQHWLRDVGQTVHHERIILYPLCIMLLYYTLCRVGSVLKTADYQDLGLKYKHVSVMIDECEGKVRRIVKIWQTDMKGKKNSTFEYVSSLVRGQPSHNLQDQNNFV